MQIMHISPAYFFPSTFWICCFRGFQETLAKNTFLLQFCLGQTIDCLRFTRLLWEMAPSGGKVVFEKEGISKLNKSLQAWSPFLSIWKHKILCITGIFSFIILLQLRWPIEWKKSQICYVVHVWIHQVRILVFENYPKCPVLHNLQCAKG